MHTGVRSIMYLLAVLCHPYVTIRHSVIRRVLHAAFAVTPVSFLSSGRRVSHKRRHQQPPQPTFAEPPMFGDQLVARRAHGVI